MSFIITTTKEIKRCEHCPFNKHYYTNHSSYHYCRATENKQVILDNSIIPNWCPTPKTN